MTRDISKKWHYGVMELIEATVYAWENNLALVIFRENDMNCLTIEVGNYSKEHIERAYMRGYDVADAREFSTKESYYYYIVKNIAGVRCLGGVI